MREVVCIACVHRRLSAGPNHYLRSAKLRKENQSEETSGANLPPPHPHPDYDSRSLARYRVQLIRRRAFWKR